MIGYIPRAAGQGGGAIHDRRGTVGGATRHGARQSSIRRKERGGGLVGTTAPPRAVVWNRPLHTVGSSHGAGLVLNQF